MSELDEGDYFCVKALMGHSRPRKPAISMVCQRRKILTMMRASSQLPRSTAWTVKTSTGDMQSRPTQDRPSSVPVPVSNLVQNSGPAPSEITMLENPGVSSLTSSSEHPEPPNDLYLSKKRLFLSLSTWKWVGNTVASFSCQLN